MPPRKRPQRPVHKHEPILNSAPVDDYALNDAGNALRLQDLHGEEMIYVPELRAWLVWDGKVWEDNPATANTYAVSVTDTLRERAARIKDPKEAARLRAFARSSGNHAKITAMLSQAALLPDMSMGLSHFDANPSLLSVGNGTLVLSDGVEFREPRPEDYCRVIVPTEYHPNDESELWLDFLNMFVPDLEIRDYLQRLAGYMLLGANAERRIVFIKGPHSTGKTTFLKLITRVLGSSVAGPFLLSLFREKGQDAPRPDMLKAMGRRFIHATEASAEWKLHADTIKRITGGDQLTARGMFSNKFVERTASFTPWIATNEYPRIEHADSALFRRLIAIPFDRVVPDGADDPEFTLRFPSGELSGVLRWMVDGYKAYREKGLDSIPDPVKDATAKLRSALSIIDRWIDDRCETGEECRYPASDLYLDYNTWCLEEGIQEHERHSQTAFGRALTERGYQASDNPERWGSRKEGRKVKLRHGISICQENQPQNSPKIRP